MIYFHEYVLAQKIENMFTVTIYETSAQGNSLTQIDTIAPIREAIPVNIFPNEQFQKILGFGGSFTEASAYVLHTLSKKNKDSILQAYFSSSGSQYSLTRTHINSCDFSLSNYSYTPISGDKELKYFSIEKDKDKDGLIPMIQQAQSISKEGFLLIASPWTAPPWMKDNGSWIGGKLLPEYNNAWANYYVKYINAYKKEGINIWGITVINEPHGNGNNWESMLFTPLEMTTFVQTYLGPVFEQKGLRDIKILGYDQNRAGLKEWVDIMYKDESSSKYFSGTAIHWYESTYDYFPKALQYAYNKAPGKYIIQTEACIDAEIPRWKDDAWYWSEEATDWGYDWAPAHEKYLHPKYTPAFRYARDIIGCLNNRVQGWIDWNMVLDKQGGPNWFKNWCIAPILADTEHDEIYITPLYYILSHFSKFIRPNAMIINVDNKDESIMTVAALNPDSSISLTVFNPESISKNLKIRLHKQDVYVKISSKALQTIVFSK
jgi:glucosylceramidase